ncbi:MAG: hypothetical protein MR033_00065 [Clostridiales bacterium]|nr:hypothetical protein [Clostridiales bacterium]
MPETRFERMIFALMTVLVTVHGYVFYSLYVINGHLLMTVNQAGSVLEAINRQGGVYMCGRFLPIWVVVLVEFILAYGLECLLGSPCSFKLVCNVFDPAETHPVLFETAIICATVSIMCPVMSFLAAWLYYPYYGGIPCDHAAGKLAEAGLLQFPVCILYSAVFYSTICTYTL